GGERGMAAREHELQPFVGNRHLVHVVLRFLLELGDELREMPLAPQPVDRLASRSDREPRTRVPRQAVSRPRLERSRERVLERVFGELDVAQVADQRRDDSAVLLAEDLLEHYPLQRRQSRPFRSWVGSVEPTPTGHTRAGTCAIGLTSTAPCSAAGIFSAYASASSRL